jgi:predicted GH43/DUF377 family glycosyl hydrolase
MPDNRSWLDGWKQAPMTDIKLAHMNRRDIILATASLAVSSTSFAARKKPAEAYLYSYFTDKNQAAGLRLAVSKDGLSFEALRDGAVFLKPGVGESGLMRDPCLFRSPQSKAPFHLVWTTSWHGQTIGYASSHDLIEWTPQRAIPVMQAFPGTRHTWAPEGIWDARHRQFVIFWSSTVTDMFSDKEGTSENDLNPRIFFTTTRDFQSFTPTRVLFDPGFQVIDASFLAGPGSALTLLFKDERKNPVKKNLRIAHAGSATGPFTVDPKPISLPDSWLEGPTGIWTGSEYRVYGDAYIRKQMMMFTSRDLSTWAETPVSTPPGMRHGTIIRVPEKFIEPLRG